MSTIYPYEIDTKDQADIIAALDGSIYKWEKIVTDGTEDGGTHDCPLCIYDSKQLSNGIGLRTCHSCPIFIDTLGYSCGSTPYVEWKSFWRALAINNQLNYFELMDSMSINNELLKPDEKLEATKLAMNELNYLKELRKRLCKEFGTCPEGE